MINTIEVSLEEFPSDKLSINKLLPRSDQTPLTVVDQVAPLLSAIENKGIAPVQDYIKRFDNVDIENIRVPERAIKEALEHLDPDVKTSIVHSIERVRQVHQTQRPSEHVTTLGPGATVTGKWVPIERVGLYVPGGRAVYPSSVIMNAIPALIAGVGSLVVCSPPQKEHGGLPHPTILATCALLGIEEVWAVGGAAAVGLMAYGAIDSDGAPLTPVDLITGPGNVFVTAAKRLVSSQVGIDSEAGPTEIAIIADDSARADFIAWDMISQAEHDPLAASVLITPSKELADQVNQILPTLVSQTQHRERIETALSGKQSTILVVPNIESAITAANAYAAEHLEIHTADSQAIAEKITQAGAIFVGPYSPVPLGDYAAGSNHVLPTSSHARYQSGLSTVTFMKLMNVIEYDNAALQEIGPDVIRMAEAEALPAHGQSIAVRMNNENS